MNKKQYLREIAERTCLPHTYRKKITDDLSAEFDAIFAQCNDERETMRRMGEPDEVAAGIYESYLAASETTRPFVEYRSKYELFGMPLVHIVKGRRQAMLRSEGYSNHYKSIPAARGIIAIGRRATGVIAIGNICCGIFAVGNISAGVITLSNIGIGLIGLGNLILGLFAALGNAAAGLFAIGNGAAGFCAVGNAAVGQYAIGRIAAGGAALSVESFLQDSLMKTFIEGLPQGFQPFFKQAIGFVQELQWYGAALAVLLVVSIAAGVVINRKIERQS